MSSYSDKVEKYLKECFPSYRVYTEKTVRYQNQELVFDYHLPELKLLIEVQGEQHYEFNKFFHRDKTDFDKQKFRDSLKTEYAAEKKLVLLALSYIELDKMTAKQFKEIVVKAL